MNIICKIFGHGKSESRFINAGVKSKGKNKGFFQLYEIKYSCQRCEFFYPGPARIVNGREFPLYFKDCENCGQKTMYYEKD